MAAYMSSEPTVLKLYLHLPAGAMLLGDVLASFSGMGMDALVQCEDNDPETLVIKVTRRRQVSS